MVSAPLVQRARDRGYGSLGGPVSPGHEVGRFWLGIRRCASGIQPSDANPGLRHAVGRAMIAIAAAWAIEVGVLQCCTCSPVGCLRDDRCPGRFHEGFKLGFRAECPLETEFETVLETLLKPSGPTIGVRTRTRHRASPVRIPGWTCRPRRIPSMRRPQHVTPRPHNWTQPVEEGDG